MHVWYGVCSCASCKEDILVVGAEGGSLLATEQLTRKSLIMLLVFWLSGECCSRVLQKEDLVMNSAGNGCPCVWDTRIGLEHTLKKRIHRRWGLKTIRLQKWACQSDEAI